MSNDFKSTKGIFHQIADLLCQRILENELPPGERVPSVRDLAGELEVNRNTLLRTYSLLEEAGIIVNKRGVGFFVADDAVELIHQRQREEFFIKDLPMFLQKVKLLGLRSVDLKELMEVLENSNN